MFKRSCLVLKELSNCAFGSKLDMISCTVQPPISQTFRFGDPQCSISSIIFALKPYNGLNESIFQGDYLAWKKYSDFIFCHLVAPKQILHGGQNPLQNGRRFAKWETGLYSKLAFLNVYFCFFNVYFLY